MVLSVNELESMLAYAKANSKPNIKPDGRNIACVIFDMHQSSETGKAPDGSLGIVPNEHAAYAVQINSDNERAALVAVAETMAWAIKELKFTSHSPERRLMDIIPALEHRLANLTIVREGKVV